MINPNTPIIEAPAQEVAVDIANNENNDNRGWRSCCFNLDRDFTLFFTKYLMLCGLMLFSGYNLSTASECVDKSLWQSLLLLVIGIALPSPGLNKYK